MSDFENAWYDKGYNDGVADALNNIGVDDILGALESLSEDEIQKISQAIQNL